MFLIIALWIPVFFGSPSLQIAISFDKFKSFKLKNSKILNAMSFAFASIEERQNNQDKKMLALSKVLSGFRLLFGDAVAHH